MNAEDNAVTMDYAQRLGKLAMLARLFLQTQHHADRAALTRAVNRELDYLDPLPIGEGK